MRAGSPSIRIRQSSNDIGAYLSPRRSTGDPVLALATRARPLRPTYLTSDLDGLSLQVECLKIPWKTSSKRWRSSQLYLAREAIDTVHNSFTEIRAWLFKEIKLWYKMEICLTYLQQHAANTSDVRRK